MLTPSSTPIPEPIRDTPTAASDTMPTVAKESRIVHRCEALRRNGTVCGFYVGTVFYDGLWRCHNRRPRQKTGDVTPPSSRALP